MGRINVLFTFIFLFEGIYAQNGCTCASVQELEMFTDVQGLSKEYPVTTEPLTNVETSECSKIVVGKEYMIATKVDDTLFTLKTQNLEDLEKNSANTNAPFELCVKVKITCGCPQPQEVEIKYYVTDTNTHDPEFLDENGAVTSGYVYDYPMPTFPSAKVEHVIVRARDIDLSNMRIDFSSPDSAEIDFEYLGLDPEDDLKKTHIGLLKLKQMIYFDTKTFKIRAQDVGGRYVEADLVLNKDSEETITISKFEKPYYEGKCQDSGVCVTDIKLDSGVADVTIVDGEHKEFFMFNPDTLSIEVENMEEIDAEYVVLLLQANPPGQLVPVNAIASLAIPKSSEETQELKIKDHPDSFIQKSTEVKDIYTFEATSSNRRDTITFSLKGDGPNGITLETTGLLRSTDTVPSGRHNLVIEAQGDVSGLKDETSVILNVLNYVICGDEVRAEQSFVVMNIEEGTSTEVLATNDELQQQGYVYNIINQYPEENMFEVTPEGSVMSKSLDREADYLSSLKLPQFTLILELQETTAGSRSNHTRRVRSTRDSDYNMVEGINMFKALEQHPQRTAVVVIVDDVNDHDPQFGVDEMIVCYPNENIVDMVKPPYLVQVQATDLDSPDGKGFGKITYSSESSEVVVEPSSGVVYPTKDIFKQNPTTFTVTATDGGGKTADLSITVNLIDEDQIGELTLSDVPFDQLDDELKKLSEKAGLQIGTFSIPVNPYEKATTSRASSYQYRIFIYALNNDAAVGIDEMQEQLETENVQLTPFNPNTNNGGGNNDSDSDSENPVGLIAAVSVLSVLLAGFIIGTGALWYFKLRPKLMAMSDDYYYKDETSSVEENKGRFEKNSKPFLNVQPPPVRRLTTPFPETKPIPEEDDDNLTLDNISITKEHKNDSIDGVKISDDDDAIKSNNVVEDVNTDTIDSGAKVDEPKEMRERRKSVTFIENVEKVEIEKSVDHSDDEDEGDDDDKDKTET